MGGFGMHSLISNDAEHASMYPLDIYVYTLFGDVPIQVVITLGFDLSLLIL